MKNPSIYTIINIEEELNSIVSFLKQTWSFPKVFSDQDIFNFVKEPFYSGLEITKNSYPASKLNSFIRKELKEKHNKNAENNFDDFLLYDGFNFMCRNLMASVSDLNLSISHQDFEKVQSKEIKKAKKLINYLDIIPKSNNDNRSYYEIRKDFEDHDTFGYFDKNDNGKTLSEIRKDLFQGHFFEGLRSFGLVDGTAIHYILQSDVNQGRKPLNELITAIISHASYISEQNNLAECFNLLKNIEIPTDFSHNEIDLPEHPFFKLCKKNNTETFEKLTDEKKSTIIKMKEDFEKLSDEDKIKIKEEKDKEIKAKMKELLKQIN